MTLPRLGCVPFLNAAPLCDYFKTPDGCEKAQLLFAPPSELARWISDGRADAALASSFLALQREGSRVAPGVSISSCGPVESVRLFSKVPLGEIRSLALDSSSLTSTHLAQIILAERCGTRPVTQTQPPDLGRMLNEHDAAVLIGDAGLTAEPGGLHSYDLGELWTDFTGLPFVWALWIGGPGLSSQLADLLADAKVRGIAKIESISRAAASEAGIDPARALRYLTEVIDFDFGESHREGLKLFAQLCAKHGFIREPSMPELVGEATVI